jgi:hypothetical protein
MLGLEKRRNGIFPIARTFCGICFLKANPFESQAMLTRNVQKRFPTGLNPGKKKRPTGNHSHKYTINRM